MVAVPLQKDLIGGLGQSAEVIGQQVDHQLKDRPLQKLKALAVPAASLGKFESAADRASDLPPFGHNPRPDAARASRQRFVSHTYYTPSVERHSTAADPFPALLDRFSRRGQILAMAIHKRDDVKMAIERTAVGRVRPDGRNDATITIETGKPKGQEPVASPISAAKVEAMAKALPPEVLQLFLSINAAQTAFGPFGVLTSGMTDAGFAGTLGIGATGGLDETSSLDAGVLKLKRMIDKRSHAMEIYSQSLTAYNNSAKGIIEKMRA